MPQTPALRLLLSAARPARAVSLCPRLARGGFGCRVLTTTDMLAAIGEAHAPIAAPQALVALSASGDPAAWLALGGSICRRAREIGLEAAR